MNHFVESVDDDYGMRDALGDAGANLSWILANRKSLNLDAIAHANLNRCCQYKVWSSGICRWLDKVRSDNDPDYRQLKLRRKQARVDKAIDRKIRICEYEIKRLEGKVRKLTAR